MIADCRFAGRLQPQSSQAFSVVFNDVPASWNGERPKLSVVGVEMGAKTARR